MSQTIDDLLAACMVLHPRVIDLSLDRLYGLLTKLGNPHLRLPPVIHIAGTNGKGSTQAMLGAILRAEGYRVDSYISPHLVRFNERIQLNGQSVSDAQLAEALTHCQKLNQQDQITFFEMTTACAFHIFAQNPADILILETGLGGRLDATNVVPDPLLTVITPISMDHQAFLGDNIGQIAAEKAGILKQNVPCVSAAQLTDVKDILQKTADQLTVPFSYEGQGWYLQKNQAEPHLVQFADKTRSFPTPALYGNHQIENAGLVMAALEVISSRFPVRQAAIDQGMKTVTWPARFQRLRTGPLCEGSHPEMAVWLDGGHNPAAGQVLAAALTALAVAPKSLYVVINMVDSKDADGFLQPLLPFIKSLAVWQYDSTHQQQSEQVFHEICAAAEIEYAGSWSDWSALKQVWPLWDMDAEAGLQGHLLICGSLYLAGHILETHHS